MKSIIACPLIALLGYELHIILPKQIAHFDNLELSNAISIMSICKELTTN